MNTANKPPDHILLDDESFDALSEVLENPPASNQKLRELFEIPICDSSCEV